MKKSLIVCVDDDADLVTAIGRSLRRDQSLEVRTTTSTTEALGWIERERVAVLVSDYEMPEMTGAQLAARARRIRPETVRILLTGLRSLETAIDGIHQGEIFRFLNKPAEDALLRSAVSDAVKRHEELAALTGELARHERRAKLRDALESEFPGISEVDMPGGEIEVTADPWSDALTLGLIGLDARLEE